MKSHIEKFILENRGLIKEANSLIMPKLMAIREEHGDLTMINAAYTILDSIHKQGGIEDKTSCGDCSFCCYASISMSSFEMEYLLQGLARKKVDIDEKLLERQNEKAWHKLKYVDTKCILLDEHGKCSNYDYRPMICRLWNSTDDPIKCKEVGVSSRTVRVVEAWAIYIGLMELDIEESRDPLGNKIHTELIKYM